jgi:hypothetical protein
MLTCNCYSPDVSQFYFGYSCLTGPILSCKASFCCLHRCFSFSNIYLGASSKTRLCTALHWPGDLLVLVSWNPPNFLSCTSNHPHGYTSVLCDQWLLLPFLRTDALLLMNLSQRLFHTDLNSRPETFCFLYLCSCFQYSCCFLYLMFLLHWSFRSLRPSSI